MAGTTALLSFHVIIYRQGGEWPAAWERERPRCLRPDFPTQPIDQCAAVHIHPSLSLSYYSSTFLDGSRREGVHHSINRMSTIVRSASI